MKWYNNNLFNYIVFEENCGDKVDEAESIINEYSRLVSERKFPCTLDFWKTYEKTFPELAILAKKYLSVPASSAAVERMFSISGHIFSVKRRRLGFKYFCELVYLKLNEVFM